MQMRKSTEPHSHEAFVSAYTDAEYRALRPRYTTSKISGAWATVPQQHLLPTKLSFQDSC